MRLYCSDDTTVEILEGRLARLYELTLPFVEGVSDIAWTNATWALGNLNPAKLIPFGSRANSSYEWTSRHAYDFGYPGIVDKGAESSTDISNAAHALSDLIILSDATAPLVIKVGGASTDVANALTLVYDNIGPNNAFDGRVQIWIDAFRYNSAIGWGGKHFNDEFDKKSLAKLVYYDSLQQGVSGTPLLFIIPIDQILRPSNISKVHLKEIIDSVYPSTLGSVALQMVLDDWNASTYYGPTSSTSGLAHTVMILNQDTVEVRQVEAPTFDNNGDVVSQGNTGDHLLHVVRDLSLALLNLSVDDAIYEIANFNGYANEVDPDDDSVSFPIDLDGATVKSVSTGHDSDEYNESFQNIVGHSMGSIDLPFAPPANNPAGNRIVWNARIHLDLDQDEPVTITANIQDDTATGLDHDPYSYHTSGRDHLSIEVLYEDEPEIPDFTDELGEAKSLIAFAEAAFEDVDELLASALSRSAQGQAHLTRAKELINEALGLN